jgi:hypothetical protein
VITPTLIRVAIRLYPPKWRRRYGAELEQLSIDLMNRRPGARRKARVCFDLITQGVDKRARTMRLTYCAGVLSFGAAAALAAVVLTAPSSVNLLPASYHVRRVSMADLTRSAPVRVAAQSMSIVAFGNQAGSPPGGPPKATVRRSTTP